MDRTDVNSIAVSTLIYNGDSMSSEAASDWQRVASLSSLVEGRPVSLSIGDSYVAVFRVADEVHVVDDVCSHEFALLSTGFLEGCIVECPLHQATFDIRTGRCLTGPATEDVKVYEVRIDGDDVLARLPRI